MNDITITGYYYRKKYDANEVSFQYDGREYITDGIRLSELSDRYKKTIVSIPKFDTKGICENLKLYHEFDIKTEELIRKLS